MEKLRLLFAGCDYTRLTLMSYNQTSPYSCCHHSMPPLMIAEIFDLNAAISLGNAWKLNRDIVHLQCSDYKNHLYPFACCLDDSIQLTSLLHDHFLVIDKSQQDKR